MTANREQERRELLKAFGRYYRSADRLERLARDPDRRSYRTRVCFPDEAVLDVWPKGLEPVRFLVVKDDGNIDVLSLWPSGDQSRPGNDIAPGTTMGEMMAQMRVHNRMQVETVRRDDLVFA